MLSEANAAMQTGRAEVIAALRQASAETGSDFNYLLGTAMRESSLRPDAKAASSSAAGLFQFVQQTWLSMIKQYGAKFGLSSYANAIAKSDDGHYSVDNQADRSAILSLRNDPKISALMAGEYAQNARAELQSRLGRPVCSGELYAAHFLGAGQACKLIEMAHATPRANAADCFPAAADANRPVFYRRDGTSKSVREVYDWAIKQPQTQLAAAAPPAPAAPAAQQFAHTASSGVNLAALAAFFGQVQQNADLSALGLFGNASTPASAECTPLPQPPFALTAGVVNVLSSLEPGVLSTAPHNKHG